MKTLIFLFLVSGGFADITYFYVCRTTTPITIDGDMADWNPNCKIPVSLNDDNVYEISSLPYNPETDWNADYYAAWDSDWVYFGIRVTVDDYNMYNTGDLWLSDGIRIHHGGLSGTYYYIWNRPLGANNPTVGMDCRFIDKDDIFSSLNPRGNGELPTYEFKIKRESLLQKADDVSGNSFRLSIGAWDEDSVGYGPFMGFGVCYGGNTSYFESQYYNSDYYPRYFLVDSIPSVVELKNRPLSGGLTVNASPNPFNFTTSISYSAGAAEKGILSIFNVAGARLFSREVQGQGRVSWNATGLASGTYLVRLKAGREALEKKLILF